MSWWSSICESIICSRLDFRLSSMSTFRRSANDTFGTAMRDKRSSVPDSMLCETGWEGVSCLTEGVTCGNSSYERERECYALQLADSRIEEQKGRVKICWLLHRTRWGKGRKRILLCNFLDNEELDSNERRSLEGRLPCCRVGPENIKKSVRWYVEKILDKIVVNVVTVLTHCFEYYFCWNI